MICIAKDKINACGLACGMVKLKASAKIFFAFANPQIIISQVTVVMTLP